MLLYINENKALPSETHLTIFLSVISPFWLKGADANPGGDWNSFICNDQQLQQVETEKKQKKKSS